MSSLRLLHRCLVVAICSLSLFSEAFVPPSISLTTPWTRKVHALFSASFDDDELSKLIGKRNQIKRKKREEIPSEDDLIEEIDVDYSSLDLDKMPDFQTKRPVRTPKKGKDDDQKDATSASSAEPVIMDYLADYEDENEFHIPNRMGISTRCWGDEKEGFVSKGKLKKQQMREGKFVPGDLQVAYNTLISDGIVLIETSPEYGNAMSKNKLSAEQILARCIQENQENDISPLLVGTYPNKIYQLGPKPLVSSLSESCENLEVSGLEVYQIKNLGWLYRSGGLVRGMTEAVIDLGTVNYVGVKNVSPLRMRRISQKLEAQSLVLTTNAFEFSLTNRKCEKWIQACKTLGVIPLIQNPLDGGLASGQFTASNPGGGIAGASAKFSFKQLEKLQPLHSVQETVAERVKTRLMREMRDVNERLRGRYGPTPKINTDITTTQVALNYIIAKGGVPLPEVNSPKQAQEVLGCLGWTLNDDEVGMLESAADLCKL